GPCAVHDAAAARALYGAAGAGASAHGAARPAESRERGHDRRASRGAVGFIGQTRRVEEEARRGYIEQTARVVELVDAGDSKSPDLRVLRVRVSPRALVAAQ